MTSTRTAIAFAQEMVRIAGHDLITRDAFERVWQTVPTTWDVELVWWVGQRWTEHEGFVRGTHREVRTLIVENVTAEQIRTDACALSARIGSARLYVKATSDRLGEGDWTYSNGRQDGPQLVTFPGTR